MTTYRIIAPHFVAAVIESSGIVIQSAPILSWCVGKDWPYARDYFRAKGYTIQPVFDDGEDEPPVSYQIGDTTYSLHWHEGRLFRITRDDEHGHRDISWEQLPNVIKRLLPQ